jgi:hypothetical protein
LKKCGANTMSRNRLKKNMEPCKPAGTDLEKI